MKRFIQGESRTQSILLPQCLDDYVGDTNPVRVFDVFVDELDLGKLSFEVQPAATGRPGYHPAVLLKLYIYGFLNRVQSSWRLEKEAQRNVELMCLTGRLTPDFKTIADNSPPTLTSVLGAPQRTVAPASICVFTRPISAFCKRQDSSVKIPSCCVARRN